MKIGIGYDLHVTAPGNYVTLGGIKIKAPFSLKGQSDADVLLHAITDALLGAIGDEDIGHYFSPSDRQNKNRDSADFVKFAMQRIQEEGYEVENLDSVIICERPKIGPNKKAIKENLANLLGTSVRQINVKGKTSEKVGPVGREEAIECHCVLLLKPAK